MSVTDRALKGESPRRHVSYGNAIFQIPPFLQHEVRGQVVKHEFANALRLVVLYLRGNPYECQNSTCKAIQILRT